MFFDNQQRYEDSFFNPFYVHAMLPFSVHSTLPKIVHAKLLITIAYLSKHESLKEMLDTFSKFSGIDDTIHVIKSLTFFDDITNLESIDLIGSKLNWELIKTRLIQMAHMPNRRFKSYPV